MNRTCFSLLVVFALEAVDIYGWKPGCNGNGTPGGCVRQTGILALSSMATAIVVLNFVEAIVPYLLYKYQQEQMEKDFQELSIETRPTNPAES